MFIPAFWLVSAPFDSNIGLLVGVIALVVVYALKISNAKAIEVDTEYLQLGSARIPRKAVGKTVVIDKDDQFSERGNRLNANAFVFLKYGLTGMVKIAVSDPKDPTPYILVSTRNPKALVSALEN